MKIKTSELTGLALDWAVASLHGYTLTSDGISKLLQRGKEMRMLCSGSASLSYSPSTDWSQGGPIIERERIDIRHRPAPWCDVEATCRLGSPINAFGPTLLVAAMRCYVASKMGDEGDVPEELTP